LCGQQHRLRERAELSLHVGFVIRTERGRFSALSTHMWGTDGAVLVVSFLLGVRVSNLAVVLITASLFLRCSRLSRIGIRIFFLAVF
jgi:hypothetical protein